MITRYMAAALICTPFYASTAVAADLKKIDRTIAKQPVYKSKSPKYCLLVFGPQAKTRVWLVHDGDVLYVDRNGNGDLTEKGERVYGKFEQKSSGNVATTKSSFSIGDILDGDGKTKHTNIEFLQLTLNSPNLKIQDSFVSAKPAGKHTFMAVMDPSGQLEFSGRPQNAPIIHFGGALQMGLGNNSPDGRIVQWEKLQHGEQFYAQVGTPGLGKGTFAALSHHTVPNNVHPIAEFQFPNKNHGGPKIKLRVVLKQRC